ncbi:MAG: ATP synthase F0 subunit B [Thermodesulfobacteriota bacterium]|nr:ATP synthase F0 subunit B [Thermodesulfobacteriota bacterium]
MSKKSLLVLCAVACILFLGTQAFAAEELSHGRKIWDNIMLFLNFGILVFLFIKYAKKPLMGFLRGEGKKIAERLDELSSRRDHVESKMKGEADRLDNIDKRILELREIIIENAQKEKDTIIEQAKMKADQMIERAKSEAAIKLAAAKKALNDEATEIAISMVQENLKKGLSPEDDERLVDQFIFGLNSNERLTTSN